jgi:hypothetical protein
VVALGTLRRWPTGSAGEVVSFDADQHVTSMRRACSPGHEAATRSAMLLASLGIGLDPVRDEVEEMIGPVTLPKR